MDLYFLRHGIAVDRTAAGVASDAERPLTPKGIAKVRRIARAMRRMELGFDLILTSPLVRARETADIVATAFKARRRLEVDADLAIGGDARALIRRLAAREPAPGAVLLVGHEPDLGELVSLLVSGGSRARVTMKKGGLCKMSAPALAPGRCATLEWLLTPRQMLLIA